ncbi:MAG TPA: NAD(P)H-hydrate dehydratase [Acidimicrobiia bacterium]|nr:NAD(P)H-hydrate dehydratase [Acidimicrobiia bacterium]
MRPILTAEEYRRVDQAYTGDLDAAMDHAGLAVALAAVRHGAGYGKRVIVLAGPGNNGGDGYVAARYLAQRGAAVVVQALTEPKTPHAIRAARMTRAAGVPVVEIGSPVPADLVIDAVFGGGGRGGLPAVVEAWTETPAPVIAVDVPTGLDPDTGALTGRAFSAVETVTFQYLKTGHVMDAGPDFCGTITVVDLGIEGGEPSLWLADEEDAPRPPRSRQTHKWSAGSVLVIGGSTGMVGAAVFAGRSALHFGAGSVVVASSCSDVVGQIAPELLTRPLAGVEDHLDRFDVVIAGPGLDEADHLEVVPLVRKAEQVLLDAGALTPEMLDAALEGGAQVVVTPHRGEFKRIAGVDVGEYAVRALAQERKMTVLLKGNPTMISDGTAPILVRSGGPELATIGTGDVLSGMAGALWARGLDARTALVSAAYWHGIAGADLAGRGTVTADRLSVHVGRFAFLPPASEASVGGSAGGAGRGAL